MKCYLPKASHRKSAFLLVSGIISTTASVLADSTWDGSDSNDWNLSANWSNGVPNGQSAIILIPGGGNPPYSATIQSDIGQALDILVGRGSGNGVLNHTAGIAATGNDQWLDVGTQGGSGTYNLANTAVINGGSLSGFGLGSGTMRVGGGNGGNGRMNVGGNPTSSATSSVGRANINTSGTLQIDNDLTIGTSGGTGTMNVDSGTITTGGWNFIGRNENNASGNGTLNMAGGMLTNNGDRTFVGLDNATGTINLSGGTYNNTGTNNNTLFAVGVRNLSSATTSSVNMSGGTINANRLFTIGGSEANGGDANGSFIGAGKGSVSLTGPAAQLNVAGDLWVGTLTTSVGALNVSAGAASATGGIVVGRNGAAGTMTISGTGPNTGTVRQTMTTGVLELTSNNAGGSATVQLNAGGILQVNGIVKNGGANATTAAINFNGGTLRANTSSTTFMQGLSGATVQAGGAKIDTNGFNITVNQALIGIANDGGLTKSGAGTLTMTGANTYTGATTVTDGTVVVNTNTVLGAGAINLAGGNLQLQGGGSGAAIGIKLGVGGNGALAIPAVGTFGVIPIAGANWNNFSGNTLGTQNGALKDSNGILNGTTLTAINAEGSYGTGSSNPLINGYIDNLSGAAEQSITVASIPYQNYSVYAYFGSDGSGRTGRVNIGGTTYSYSTRGNVADFVVTTDTATSNPSANYAIFGGLSGSDLVLNQLRGSNNSGLHGLEIVENLPVSLTNALNITADSSIAVDGRNTAAISGTTTLGANTLSVTGTSSGPNVPYTLTLGGIGGVTLVGTPAFNVANNGTGAGTLALGTIGASASGINKTGAGTLLLSGANAHSGPTTVNAGTVRAASAGTAFGNNSAVIMTDVAGATLDLNGFNTQVGSLAGGGASGGNVTLGAATLTVNGTTAAVPPTYAGAISGPGGLTKASGGTQRLTGVNTYTGATNITGGSLLVSGTGSIANSSGITVASGGLLGGNGTIGSVGDPVPVMVQGGGTLSPGNSPDQLTMIGDLMLNPGANFLAEIALGGVGAPGNGTVGTDLLSVTGGISLGGANLIGTFGGTSANIFRGNYTQDTLFFLLNNDTNTDPITGTFANSVAAPGLSTFFGVGTGVLTPFSTIVGGQQFALFYNAQFATTGLGVGNLSGGNDLLLIAIPEPGRVALLGMAALMLIGRRRRK